MDEEQVLLEDLELELQGRETGAQMMMTYYRLGELYLKRNCLEKALNSFQEAHGLADHLHEKIFLFKVRFVEAKIKEQVSAKRDELKKSATKLMAEMQLHMENLEQKIYNSINFDSETAKSDETGLQDLEWLKKSTFKGEQTMALVVSEKIKHALIITSKEKYVKPQEKEIASKHIGLLSMTQMNKIGTDGYSNLPIKDLRDITFMDILASQQPSDKTRFSELFSAVSDVNISAIVELLLSNEKDMKANYLQKLLIDDARNNLLDIKQFLSDFDETLFCTESERYDFKRYLRTTTEQVIEFDAILIEFRHKKYLEKLQNADNMKIMFAFLILLQLNLNYFQKCKSNLIAFQASRLKRHYNKSV